MRRILGAVMMFAVLTIAGPVWTTSARAGSAAEVVSKDHADLRPTDISARRYHHRRNHQVYSPYYQPHWRWGRPYYYRPYYSTEYYQPYYNPYGYGPGRGYYGWGARYYGWAPRYYGWGPRNYGCCGWGWGGPRFYGPAFGVGFGF